MSEPYLTITPLGGHGEIGMNCQKWQTDKGVVLVAVVFCFIIGVIFGLYPANKAAKMKPIDALHYGG